MLPLHSIYIVKIAFSCVYVFCYTFQYGPVFSFTMVGKTFTYLVGSESSALMFNSKNDHLNAEDVYSRLVTPVFGKGVAYDVPNPVSIVAYLILYILPFT